MNIYSKEARAAVVIDMYNDLVEEKNTKCHSPEDFEFLCQEINYYKKVAFELAGELGVKITK